jgi:hypothetical protein
MLLKGWIYDIGVGRNAEVKLRSDFKRGVVFHPEDSPRPFAQATK